jgi:putative DNA-invertase from lambdoid prophage Rac
MIAAAPADVVPEWLQAGFGQRRLGGGRLQLGVLMAVAEFERGIIRERVKAGVTAAKVRGVKLGRPPKLKARAPEFMKLNGQGLGVRAIARSLGMEASSVHSLLEWAERGGLLLVERSLKAATRA